MSNGCLVDLIQIPNSGVLLQPWRQQEALLELLFLMADCMQLEVEMVLRALTQWSAMILTLTSGQ